MPITPALPLDHTVINVHFDMNRAQAIFESLGFQLTPRGRHSLGSINHLIVLKDDYVEIVGLPTDTDQLRQEVLESPIGIDGLVFQTINADQTHGKLIKKSLPAQPVQAFSRPVELDGDIFHASFRTTRFSPGTYSAGRVYFCQHLTPQLVWRKEWLKHPNKVEHTAGFLIVADSPASEAAHYLAASGGLLKKGMHGDYRIRGKHYELVFVTPAQYLECFGDLACTNGGRSSFFGAIALKTKDMKSVSAHVQIAKQRFPDLRVREQKGRITVSIPSFNALIDFIQ